MNSSVSTEQHEKNTFSIGRIDTRELIASTNNMIYIPDDVVPCTPADTREIVRKAGNSGRADASPDQACDTIFLKSGGTLIGKVEEIGQSEIKYRKCNNLSGPVISVLKSDVSAIRYTNGTIDHFGPSDAPVQVQRAYVPEGAPVQKTEGLGLAGFISSLAGLFVAGVLLGIIGVVFGGVSLSKIRRNPRAYRGRGFATAAIIIGVIAIVGAIIVMGTL